jgi:hypothetical protein
MNSKCMSAREGKHNRAPPPNINMTSNVKAIMIRISDSKDDAGQVVLTECR